MSEIKDEIKRDVRRTLDATQEALQRQLVDTVNRHQHNSATLVDIENAKQNLENFIKDKWRKEKSAIDAIDKS
jgi:hypothetical protein